MVRGHAYKAMNMAKNTLDAVKDIVISENKVTIVEYVWIGGNNELRSKTKVVNKEVKCIDCLSDWNYDGSSTAQADGADSEVIIKPRALFNDPFRKEHHKIVMCDTYTPDGEPHVTNKRNWANELFNQKLEEEPWFGLEQEYFLFVFSDQRHHTSLLQSDTNIPL